MKSLSRLALVLALALAGCAFDPLRADAQSVITLGGRFIMPVGVALDGSGNVLVVDRNDSSVKKIAAAGGFTQVTTVATGFAPPASVAVDGQGNLYAVDPYSSKVYEVVAAGGYQTVKIIGSGFNQPLGVAVDANGNVFVADTFNNAVKEVPVNGSIDTVISLGTGFDHPRGIAVDSAGNVFVADYGNGAVKKIRAAGNYADIVTLGSGFSQPTGVAVDAAGDVFVGDSGNGAVKEILAVGGYSDVKTLSGGYSGLAGIALDQYGNLYVADWGSQQVTELSVVGGYTVAKSVVNQDFAEPSGVAVDSIGNIYIADQAQGGIKEVLYGHSDVQIQSNGLSLPFGVAVDAHGNILVADTFNYGLEEIVAANGYSTPKEFIAWYFFGILGVTTDSAGNVYYARTNAAPYTFGSVQEILAAGDYSNVITLGNGLSNPAGVAVDAQGNIFVADTGNNAIKEVIVSSTNPSGYSGVNTIATGLNQPYGIALDSAGNIYVADTFNSAVKELLASSGYTVMKTLGSGFSYPFGVAVDASGNVYVADTGNQVVKEILAAPPSLAAAVLPGARSVELGKPATVLATLINTGPDALMNCAITLPADAPAGLTLTYQMTDPTTNALTGKPDVPATIPGNDGSQSFLISFLGTQPFSQPAMPLGFGCDNTSPAAIVPGLDTVDLTLSASPTADVIAEAATLSNDGIAHLPVGGTGAFAIASVNVGAEDSITVSIDTGSAALPVTAMLCETEPASGQCLAPPAATVTLDYAGNATPTFSVFLQASEAIAFAPATTRIFVRFKDAKGGLHGETSVAIETQ